MEVKNLTCFLNEQLFQNGAEKLTEKQFVTYCDSEADHIDPDHLVSFNRIDLTQQQFRELCKQPVEELSPLGLQNYLGALSIWNHQVFGDKAIYASGNEFIKSRIGKMLRYENGNIKEDKSEFDKFMSTDWNGCLERVKTFCRCFVTEEYARSDEKYFERVRRADGTLAKQERKVMFWRYEMTQEQFRFLQQIPIEKLTRQGVGNLLGCLSIWEPNLFADMAVYQGSKSFDESEICKKAKIYAAARAKALKEHEDRKFE